MAFNILGEIDVVVSEDHEKRTSPMSKMRTDDGVVKDMKKDGGRVQRGMVFPILHLAFYA